MKRNSRKKAKDKPKRPLSAYNYFFKTERQRILKYLARKSEGNGNDESNEEEEEVVSAEQESKLVTESGKVSFEEMGKLIGRRWKAISPEKLEHYNKLAALDAERYKKELAEYNDRKEKGAIHEAQRNAMMQSMGQGPPGDRGYYPPPPYGQNPSGMGMYGGPYNSGMGGPPYMGGPMYHGHYGSGYPEYGSGSYGGRSSHGDSSYPPPQGGPPMHPHGQSHHSQAGPGSSSGYSQGAHSMDPYGPGSGGPPPVDYPPMHSSQGPHHHSDGGPPPPPSHGGYGSSSGGYPSQSYGGPGGYGQYPPSGAPQDQGGHQRWA